MKRFCALLSIALGLVLSFLMPSRALAQCVVSPSSAINAIEVSASLPIGSLITQFDMDMTGNAQCRGVQGVTSSRITPNTLQTVYPGVYNTTITGIGYRAQVISAMPSVCQISSYFLPLDCTDPRTGSAAFGIPQTYRMRIWLYKTAEITAGRQFTLSGNFASWSHGGGPPIYARFSWGTITISPTRPTCSIAPVDRTLTVQLDSIPASDFRGVGTFAPAAGVPFNLAVTCTGGEAGALERTVDVRATDATNPGNASQVLSLTTASTARGVGVQLRRGGTALTYGARTGLDSDANQWRAGSVGTGTGSRLIPLNARYVQTAEPVTAGSANAQAIFTFIFN